MSDNINAPPVSLTLTNDDVIKMGLKVENLISAANRATQGLIMTGFMTCVACLIVFCFFILANIGLNDLHTGAKLALLSTAYILAVTMYLIRIFSLMASGQQLANKVKLSRRNFENTMIDHNTPSFTNEENCNRLSVLRKRLETYQYLFPISPFSVFQLNNRTFCATLATIITYMVVLIKLRGVETSKTVPISISTNGTALY